MSHTGHKAMAQNTYNDTIIQNRNFTQVDFKEDATFQYIPYEGKVMAAGVNTFLN